MAARVVCRADVGLDDAYRASLWVTAVVFLTVWLTLDIAGREHVIAAAVIANVLGIAVGTYVYGRNLLLDDEFPIDLPRGAVISVIIAAITTTAYFVWLY
jgi:hypothetical protein